MYSAVSLLSVPSTHPSAGWLPWERTSSTRMALSGLEACCTHFSTTLEANLCCESGSTFAFTASTILDLSSYGGKDRFYVEAQNNVEGTCPCPKMRQLYILHYSPAFRARGRAE